MNSMPSKWGDIPYYPISQFYKSKFGCKVYKIPVSVAQTCPNREGLNNTKVCIFCDEWGSAAYPEFRDEELLQQIGLAKEKISRRFRAKKFLVYFQAYTNSFGKVNQLYKHFEVAKKVPDVAGFIIGTRPDCLSEALYELINIESKKYFVAIELGVQTFNDKQLQWMERGHSANQSIKAIQRIKKKTQVDLGIHLMFGLPDETDQQIIKTAQLISELPIDNVKLHNLHVLAKTPLESMYYQGKFKPISRAQYADRVMLFLQNLNPDIAVQRLAAVASRHDELIAPKWAAAKLDNYQFIIDRMKSTQSYQGQRIPHHKNCIADFLPLDQSYQNLLA